MNYDGLSLSLGLSVSTAGLSPSDRHDPKSRRQTARALVCEPLKTGSGSRVRYIAMASDSFLFACVDAELFLGISLQKSESKIIENAS